jgi:hypothetical protein
MRRIRWAVVLLAGMALVGLGGATVFARSTATYSNNAISASDFTSTGNHGAPAQADWFWLSNGAGQMATWVFDVSELKSAINGTVYLNVAALSASPYWGSGYSTDLRIVVHGVGTGTLTTTLANPWRPHVAYNNTAGVGWNATATLAVPRSVWAGASTLEVTATPITVGNHVGFNQGALTIGYATTP